MRWLLLGPLAVLALAGLAAAFAGWSSLPTVEGRIALSGLGAPVEVRRDANAIPYIKAGSQADAYFALGFVHAQDRLWQMEQQRRLIAGRLSEIFGERTLGSDRFMRTLGLYRAAEWSLAHLSEPVRTALGAYAAGVNAYLDEGRGALAPEFTLLWHSPEPWRPADCLAFGKLMALTLAGNWRRELLRARLAARLTPEQLASLWPDSAEAMVTLAQLYRGLPLDGLADHVADGWRVANASNEWVVAGSRTRSGKPLLANDPHLRFAAPILWYLARIEAPGLTVAGATVPGVPFHLFGHNGRIAWGFANTHSDVQDLFIERVADGDAGRYLTPEGSEPFRVRAETIVVRGGDTVTLSVRTTRHGPVISDVAPQAARQADPGSVIALAFPALDADDTSAQAIYRLNRADGWAAFVAALSDFHGPQQNVVYADVDGNIGFYAPARVPVRRNGKGLAPVPGWTGEYDWTGRVPTAALPKALNPPGGVIVNANNRIVGPDYPHFLAAHWESDTRARRIGERIEAARSEGVKLTVEGFMALQQDTESLAARTLLPLMLARVTPEVRTQNSLDRLAGWDGAMDRRRAEPLIFTAWLRELNRALYADELGPAFADYWRLRPEVVAHMLEADPAWCDVVTTPRRETCAERLSSALNRALDWIEARYGEDPARWRWGAAHRASFRHRVLDLVPLLGRLADLEIETDGGDDTVNRGTSDITDPDQPFAHIHGAGFRAVYDLAELGRSRFVIATGQSGNPLSTHYHDFLRRWRDGEYVPMPAVPEGPVRRLLLLPRG
ncbi:MAG: penicillin acylase family protein [Kiloniellales bacterium]